MSTAIESNMPFSDLINWFTGGPQHQYMPLWHCLDGDGLWVAITVSLDVLVATGYCLIAYHWYSNQKLLPPSPAKKALANMRNIFVFCGLCGYGFIPIKMVWPAWRLYDAFMLVLVYFTWRYAWGARDLKVIYSEMSRTRKLESDLRQSQAESEQKTFFLNAVSHDLRTPLNGLVLQANVAEVSLDTGDPETAKQAMREVQANAQAAAALLDSLLEVGRLDFRADPCRSEPVTVADALAAAVQPFREQAAAKGVALRVTADPGLTIETDPLKLQRVLTNLVHNATKFTHHGSIEVSATSDDREVRIAIEDTGEGIADEHHERLFEEFYQVHNRERDRRKGFGLGLAIASRLVRQLNGRITVDSAVGRGSRFTVVLPRAAPAPVPGPVDRPAALAGAATAGAGGRG